MQTNNTDNRYIPSGRRTATTGRLLPPPSLVMLALLCLLGLPGPPGLTAQEVPTSRWWYPAATPEATRRNDSPTAAQRKEELRIKWRTTALPGSRELLIGALSTPSGSLRQQIVGLRRGVDTVVILDDNGFVDTLFNAVAFEGSGARAVRLTGLFNSTAVSAMPSGRPDLIGVAIEREVLSATNPVMQGYGMIFRPDGTILTRLGLTAEEADQVRGNQREANRYVTLYPVAYFTPSGSTRAVAFALLSQERFYSDSTTAPNDRLINSLRTYAVPETPPAYTEPTEPSFRIAPKSWRAQPALTWISGSGAHIFSLATEAYGFTDTVFSPLQAETSRTNEAAAMHLRIAAAGGVARGISEYLASGTRASRSLFGTLVVDRDQARGGPESRFMRFAWDLREERQTPGPRLQLTNVQENTPQGIVNTPDSLPFDGLEVILADLDGTAPGAPHPNPILVNNPGPEIVVSRRSSGTDAFEVLIYRFNERVPIGIQALGAFTRQRLRGRIVAAGDIVADGESRRELLLIDRDTLRILQLRSYVTDSMKITPFNPDLAEPFAEIARFGLGDSILSAVIADVEGDGENDIVVATGSATVLIGRISSPPFAFTTEPEQTQLCPADTITLAWERRSVGGGAGIRVVLIGPDGERVITNPGVLSGNRLRASPQELNIGIPGEYRLVVSDAALPHLADTSLPFTYVTPMLGTLDFASAPAVVRPGDLLLDTIAARCVERIGLEWSSDGTSWMPVAEGDGEVVRLPGRDSAVVRALLPCPSAVDCGAPLLADRIFYRLVTARDVGRAHELRLHRREIALELVPSDTSLARRREVRWSAADLECDRLHFTLVAGSASIDLGVTAGAAGSLTFDVPIDLSDSVRLCVRCDDPGGCAGGVADFRVPGSSDGNFVAPNPFSPGRSPGGEGGATIAFTLPVASQVSIAILDAGRSTVRHLLEARAMEPGRHRETWDGTDRDGKPVANGTYFCVISFSAGENIVIPFIVIQ